MAILAAAAALSLVSCAGSPPPRPVEPPPLPPPPVATRFVAPKVGVALGGGGARGLAEVGVLRVLEQEKIPIDVVVGTSVGSLIGALYADTGRVLDAEFLAVQVEAEDIFDFSALSLFNGGFAKGERIEQFVRTHLKHRTIEEMAVPFAAVATNLRTGRAVAFDRGSVATAVRASAAIPGVFQPVLIGGITYVDGGVVDPVPVGVARKKGADVAIAVAIPPAVPSKAPENPFEVVHHSITIMAAEIGRLRSREADVLIEPEVGDVRYDDFSPKKRLIEAGEAAARKALPAIRAAIAAKTREVPVP